MSIKTWPHSFSALLRHEGGFVNHPRDPGGMTNLGVTRKAWQEWVKRDVSEAEMRALTPEIVKPFYKQMYWDRVRGDDLPAGVDHMLFDIAVNSGPGRAVRFVQEAVGVPVDGGLGPRTLAAISDADPVALMGKISTTRLAFMKALETWPVFGKGWESRVNKVHDEALWIHEMDRIATN